LLVHFGIRIDSVELFGGLDNAVKHLWQFAEYFVVRASNDMVSMQRQMFGSSSVILCPSIVYSAVDFHDQSATWTEEIKDEPADWMLSPKLQST